MQIEYKIVVTTDDAEEPGKNAALLEAVKYAARNLISAAEMLYAGAAKKPVIEIEGDDWYGNHYTISLLDDKISKGIAQIEGKDPENAETAISDEMIAALKEMGQ